MDELANEIARHGTSRGIIFCGNDKALIIPPEDEAMPEDGPMYMTYPTYRNGKKATAVEVQDCGSEYVRWTIKDGKMIKTFDMSEVPF